MGLGFEFARAADAAVASALRNPFGHLRIEEEFRRVLFRKFPYTLIYLPNPDELLVVSFISIVSQELGWSGLVVDRNHVAIPQPNPTLKRDCAKARSPLLNRTLRDEVPFIHY